MLGTRPTASIPTAMKRPMPHSGLLDMNTLEAGQIFDELLETYVILITRDDVLSGELPIYHIERMINENGDRFGDGAHIIYVNSKIQNDTPLGRLMHDFHCKEAEEMYSSNLANRVRATDLEVGEVKKAKETVISLLEMGLPVEKIAQAVNYSVQKVQEWIAESMNLA